jgi:hypothetical protein
MQHVMCKIKNDNIIEINTTNNDAIIHYWHEEI